MKLSIERGTLLKAVAQAQSVVERRNTIPILANVLIEAEGDDVHFRATDLDIEVVDKAPHRSSAPAPPPCRRDAARDRAQAARRRAGHAEPMTAAGRLTVEAGRSNFSLATLPKEDFPVMASSEYASELLGPGPGAAPPVRQVEIRHFHRGDALLPQRCLHARRDGEGGKVLRCVATDGHRLARIDADLPEGAEECPA